MDAQRLKQLLKKIHCGDTQAFEELYDFYFKRTVARLSVSFGRQVAEDSTQDFFVKLINPEKTVDYTPLSTSWIYVCCENIAKTKTKKERRYITISEDIQAIDDILRKEEYLDIVEMLRCLDDDSQKIIKLFYFSGYSLLEVSDLLHIKYAAVRKKHSRAIKKLKIFEKKCHKTQD